MDYRREIDGLRALAVLPVILFHAGFETFSGGFVGVDVFFVISGYLITTIILAELAQGKFSIVNFYERRARRIFPALFLVMLFCIPFAWFWLMPSDMKDFTQSLVAVSVFASNILFWRESGYFDTAAEIKPLLHTWSLAVEEQYYVLFPLFLILAWRLGKRWILILLTIIGIASLAVAQWASVAKPAAAFYLLPTRGWELLIGAFAAFYLSKTNRTDFSKVVGEVGGWLGLALILFSVFTYSKETPFPGLYALVPTVGAVLIILFATQQTTIGKFVGNRAFVGIGLVSYSAYLWHQPLFAFARLRDLSEPSDLVFAVLSVAALILAYFSWRYAECPFRRKNIFSAKSIFQLCFAGSLLISIFGFWGHLSNGFSFRVGEKVAATGAINISILEEQVKTCWKSIESDQRLSFACSLGNPSGSVSFALLGDSHAGALLPVLSEHASQSNLRGLNFSYRSCPPLRDIKPLSPSDVDMVCWKLRKNFFESLARSSGEIPKVVVINARWALLMERDRFDNEKGGVESGDKWVWDFGGMNVNYPDLMRNEIVDAIEEILNTGRKVVLIYPVPEMGWEVPKVLAKRQFTGKILTTVDGSTLYPVYLKRNKRAIEALDSLGERDNLIRIRPDKLLCNTFISGRCVAHMDGVPLYFDNNHLSNEGAKLIVMEIMNSLRY